MIYTWNEQYKVGISQQFFLPDFPKIYINKFFKKWVVEKISVCVIEREQNKKGENECNNSGKKK